LNLCSFERNRKGISKKKVEVKGNLIERRNLKKTLKEGKEKKYS